MLSFIMGLICTIAILFSEEIWLNNLAFWGIIAVYVVTNIASFLRGANLK